MTLTNKEQCTKLKAKYTRLVNRRLRGYSFREYDMQSARAEIECRIVQTSDVIGELEKLQWRGY